VFSARSMLRCYKEDKWSYKGVCEERTCSGEPAGNEVSAEAEESGLLEGVTGNDS
jgi:hypothetical protein